MNFDIFKPKTPPLFGLEIDWNGHTPVYGAAPPTSVGSFEVSAGNFVQTNVSCTKRERRNARLLSRTVGS